MGDFRVGSTSGIGAQGEASDRKSRARKKVRHSDGESGADEYVPSSSEAEEKVDDFYTPSERDDAE